MTQEELNKVLENHKHWIYQDCVGWEDMRADLSNADLSNLDLQGADLRYAKLSGANLLIIYMGSDKNKILIPIKKYFMK